MDAAKESYVADEGGNNVLFEISKLFDQVILLLGQAVKLCSALGVKCPDILCWGQEKCRVKAEKQCKSIFGGREHVVWV